MANELLASLTAQTQINRFDSQNAYASSNLSRASVGSDSEFTDAIRAIFNANSTTVAQVEDDYEFDMANSSNSQVKEFAALNKTLSDDWGILTARTTPKDYNALRSFSDSLVLAGKFANAMH